LSFTFDGGWLNNDLYKFEVDGGVNYGLGDFAGTARGASGCDEADTRVFEGFDQFQAGWTSGAVVQLYCVCPAD
jgi:hypothetical protein